MNRRRIAGIMLVAVAAAAIPSAWFAGEAIATLSNQIEARQMALAQLAATQADRVVAESFYEIELMAQQAQVRGLASLPSEIPLHDRTATFHDGVVLLDEEGSIVTVEPASTLQAPHLGDLLDDAAVAGDRFVTPPWLDPTTKHAMTAMSVPIFGDDGSRTGTILGVVDLAEPLITDLVVPAARLGPTGHADLVDERGVVLASTDPDHVLSEGDHPDFYTEASGDRIARVAVVEHLHSAGDTDTSHRHLMAYAPLQNAPWGVAIGAARDDLMQHVDRFRYRIVVVGVASLLTVLAGIGLAVRLIGADPNREG